jgi:hypothetical protein
MSELDLEQFMQDNDLSPEDMDELLRFIRDNGEYLGGGYKAPPVSPEQFLLDPFYLGLEGQVYPKVLDEYIEICSRKYQEVVFTGSIGSAKTSLALWVTAYQLYLVSLLEDPQKVFGLDHASEILFILQSLNEKKAVNLNFGRFKTLIKKSPYFATHFPHNAGLESELQFPNRVIVRPVSGDVAATIGENVMSAIIDELNFMAVVENSKQASEAEGTYNQAVALYNSIARRRKSRFMLQGKTAGMLCLVSSKKYPGEFTDQRIEAAQRDATIYVYDKRTWDVFPEDRFTGEWFPIFIGDLAHKPKILDDEDEVPQNQQHLLDWIPEEYREDFETDIINALRDIAGKATRATNPFFTSPEKVAAAFGTRKSVLSLTDCDFVNSTPLIYPKRFKDKERFRWVHLDLSISGDCTGVACGYVSDFKTVERGGQVEKLPMIDYDFLLRVHPPRGGEILYFKIRSLIYKLQELGLNIRWISFDSFQSRDSIQVLRQKGFSTGLLSMDKELLPYDTLKTAIYDGRVSAPEHETAHEELISLERDLKKGKVDHPPQGSKDVGDAMAGVCYGLTTRKETYLDHDVSLFEIPQYLRTAMTGAKQKMHEGNYGVDEDIQTPA